MLDFRFKSFKLFLEMPTSWVALYQRVQVPMTLLDQSLQQADVLWNAVRQEIKRTFDKYGAILKLIKIFSWCFCYINLVVYQNMEKELEEKGIIFKDTDSALQENEELFKKYFASVVPAADNKFAALNSAVWSGGSFIYVPKN